VHHGVYQVRVKQAVTANKGANLIERKSEFDKLPVTEDFIAFVQPHDARLDQHYYALQKTVPVQKIKRLMGLIYGEFLD
jgi:hypothetical protein